MRPCPSLLPTDSSPPSLRNPCSSGSPCPPTTPPTHYPRPRDHQPLTRPLTPLHPLHSCQMSAPAPFPFCSLSPSWRQTIHKACGGHSPLLLPRLLASDVRPPSITPFPSHCQGPHDLRTHPQHSTLWGGRQQEDNFIWPFLTYPQTLLSSGYCGNPIPVTVGASTCTQDAITSYRPAGISCRRNFLL